MDRFSQGLPDPQDVPVVDECAACGAEIYHGQQVVQYGVDLVCNYKCLHDLLGATNITAGEA